MTYSNDEVHSTYIYTNIKYIIYYYLFLFTCDMSMSKFMFQMAFVMYAIPKDGQQRYTGKTT